MLWTPLVFLYVMIPLLDYLFPNDRSNPPEQIVPQLEADAYYRGLNHLTVPLHFVTLNITACYPTSCPMAVTSAANPGIHRMPTTLQNQAT